MLKQKICRTCVTLHDEPMLIPIFEEITITTNDNEDFQLTDELIALNIEIEKDDDLPQQICIDCVKQVTRIYSFRQLCKKSYFKLKEYFINHKNIKIKKDVIANTDDNFQNNLVKIGHSDNFKNVIVSTDLTDLTRTEEELENELIEIDYEAIENEDQIAPYEEIQIENDVKNQNIEENKESPTIEQQQPQNQNVNSTSIKQSSKKSKRRRIPITKTTEKILQCERCNKYKHTIRYRIDFLVCHYFNESQKSIISDFCCFYCNQKFENKSIIENHILKLHPINKPFLCTVCNEYFPTYRKRRMHFEKNHFDDKNYKCDICDKKFKKLYYVKQHKRIHDDGTYECKICYKNFTNSYRFHYHLLSHNPEKKFKCKYCDRRFMQRPHLKFHEEIHAGKTYTCERCYKKFIHKIYYVAHIKIHKGDTPFQCDECEKSFPSKCLLSLHKKVHNSSPLYQCEFCGAQFLKNQLLKYHVANLHEKNNLKHKTKQQLNKFHTCPICSKKFLIPTALKNHMKMHDKNRGFPCHMCKNSYKQIGHLKMHINRVHSKLRSYDCPLCNKKFYDVSTRNFHLKCHTGRVKCSYCDKIYSCKKNLEKHVTTSHTQVKNFKCVICEEAFVSYLQFRNHYTGKHTAEERQAVENNILAEVNQSEEESDKDYQEVYQIIEE